MLFLFILLASLGLQLFFPWWVIAPVAFLLALWKSQSGWHAFRSGFLAIFMLWIAFALWKSIPNEHILANRVAQLLTLPEWRYNWLIMLALTGFTGGLVAGLSALSGFYWRKSPGR